MNTVSVILIALVAVEHLYILVLEMFLWTGPKARRTFGTTEDFARETKALAANQGLYNGFLAAGLIWGLLHPDSGFAFQLQLFFLICVACAAIYGSVTSSKSILLKQGAPAGLALAALLVAHFM
ncbi:MAG: rane protein [Paenibacillaceae bacterium]|jgi:putative membrane protein|nr:rane protein [Paenibacillaceae bacterium]